MLLYFYDSPRYHIRFIRQLLLSLYILYVLYEEFEDIKGVIRISISKNRQHNGQEKVQKDKQRSTKHTHKTKD